MASPHRRSLPDGTPANIAVAHGAERETVFGLSGLGDLFATATSPDSRNRRFGQSPASGKGGGNPGWLREGVRACVPALSLAARKRIPAPMAEWIRKSVSGEPPALESLVRSIRTVGQF